MFALKAGLGFGGAITGYVLGALRLRAERGADRARALEGIRYTMSVFPAIMLRASVPPASPSTRIDKALEIRDPDELTERRKRYAPSGA